MNRERTAKEDCMPLFRKGDRFVIIKRNSNPQLMPLEAMKLKDHRVYGFYEGELE